MDGRIEIYGFLPHKDLRKTINTYNCFIGYSKKTALGDNEGIPNLLLENILSGNLVFSTLTGGIGELFSDGAPNALSGDIEEDANKIARIFPDTALIHEMIRKNFTKTREMFHPEKSIVKLENSLLDQNE